MAGSSFRKPSTRRPRCRNSSRHTRTTRPPRCVSKWRFQDFEGELDAEFDSGKAPSDLAVAIGSELQLFLYGRQPVFRTVPWPARDQPRELVVLWPSVKETQRGVQIVRNLLATLEVAPERAPRLLAAADKWAAAQPQADSVGQAREQCRPSFDPRDLLDVNYWWPRSARDREVLSHAERALGRPLARLGDQQALPALVRECERRLSALEWEAAGGSAVLLPVYQSINAADGGHPRRLVLPLKPRRGRRPDVWREALVHSTIMALYVRRVPLHNSDDSLLARVVRLVLKAADQLEGKMPLPRNRLTKDLSRWLQLLSCL